MSKVQRFWSHEARNIRCVREADYDALHAEAEALRAENGRLAESLRVAHHNLSVGFDTEASLTSQLEAARGLLRELIGAVRTINHGPQHKIMVKGDDQPSYWQRQEWVVYLLRMCNEAEAALTATPAPEVPASDAETKHAAALIARHGQCANYPGCGCKVHHGFDCIPF